MALPNLSQISEALDKIMPELTPVPVGTVAYAHEVPTGWLQCKVLRSAHDVCATFQEDRHEVWCWQRLYDVQPS